MNLDKLLFWTDICLGLFFLVLAVFFLITQMYHPWSWVGPLAASVAYHNKAHLSKPEVC